MRQEVDGPAVGRGKRWRHQLTAGPFGPAGEIEVVDVKTPHIGGVMEFFRFTGDSLQLAAALPSVTTHAIGSRNLDQTVAGDFNGDGQPEVLALDEARRALVAVQRDNDGAAQVWRLDAAADVVSNFAPVELLDGGLAMAVGTADARLRIWLPR